MRLKIFTYHLLQGSAFVCLWRDVQMPCKSLRERSLAIFPQNRSRIYETLKPPRGQPVPIREASFSSQCCIIMELLFFFLFVRADCLALSAFRHSQPNYAKC